MFDLLPQFNEVTRTFEDPQRLHAIMVHLPIGAAVLGFILTLGVALTGSKASGLRWTTIFIFLLGTLAALWTVQTGEDAKLHLPVQPSTIAADALDKHQQLAEFFWIGLAATGVLILLSTFRITWLRSITLLLAVLISLANVGWVVAIGHYGGEMVYRHSVGVPSAGPEHDHPQHTTPPVDPPASKDKSEPDKDKIEDKDKAVDPPATKDKAEEKAKDKAEDPGERKLPPVEPKDKSVIFCE